MSLPQAPFGPMSVSSQQRVADCIRATREGADWERRNRKPSASVMGQSVKIRTSQGDTGDTQPLPSHLRVLILPSSQLSKCPKICCHDDKAGKSTCMTGLHHLTFVLSLKTKEDDK